MRGILWSFEKYFFMRVLIMFLGILRLRASLRVDHKVRSWKMAFFHGPTSWSNFHDPIS